MRHQVKTSQLGLFSGFRQAVYDFGVLVKFKLTLLVLFSALMSYAIICEGAVDWSMMAILAAGGFLVTGAANALNQVLEREFDLLMPRTMNRPVATGRLSVSSAVLMAGMMALFGISFLAVFNPLTGFLGTLSLISYAFVYTPMKRSTAWAVLVGAVPGALPLIIGCVAFEGYISPMALLLFTLQFLWQFPHFWAVAWLADEDYKKAGFYLLPSKNGEKDYTTGLFSFVACVAMIFLIAMAWFWSLIGFSAMLALNILNAYWAWSCWKLYRECSREAARKQMFISFLHLPFSLIVLLLDKIL